MRRAVPAWGAAARFLRSSLITKKLHSSGRHINIVDNGSVIPYHQFINEPKVWLMGAGLLGCALYGWNMFTGPKVTEPHVYLDFTSEGRPLGRVVVGLYGKLTPEVAQNFHGLATHSEGFGYRGSPVHHVVRKYVVMAGDVTKGDGTGGASIFGPRHTVRSAEARLVRGTVAMVQDDEGGIRSQFFVSLMPMTPELSKEMAACGRVLSGMEVLDAISEMPTDSNGRPLQPVVIADSGEVGAAPAAAPASAP
uniref:Peptidyl-prolyl cis-trans isomerase n=1 Tax=Dunaliella tertiolecta TaxID=3047 RepID=A0A7S3QNL9_DUNTE|mmetsp:Transcript_6926/g.18595  ORF Transcript_6926/g.18595 Transcript_6926/m.18595 type:complete len:251 (+) Transcript_6926:1612-2364(+)